MRRSLEGPGLFISSRCPPSNTCITVHARINVSSSNSIYVRARARKRRQRSSKTLYKTVWQKHAGGNKWNRRRRRRSNDISSAEFSAPPVRTPRDDGELRVRGFRARRTVADDRLFSRANDGFPADGYCVVTA